MPLVVDVALQRDGLLIGHFKTRLIGHNAIQIDTGTKLIETHERCTISFIFAQQRFEMKGICTYCAENTATFLFTHYFTAYFNATANPTEQAAPSATMAPQKLETAESAFGARKLERKHILPKVVRSSRCEANLESRRSA